MSNETKTPEQRARELAYSRAVDSGRILQIDPEDRSYDIERIGGDVQSDFVDGFLAGRADFITSELPKLLEKARYGEVMYTEQALSDDAVFKYTIEELIEMAEEGET